MRVSRSKTVKCIVCGKRVPFKEAFFIPGNKVQYACKDCDEIVTYCDLDYTPEGIEFAQFILQAQKDFDEVYEKQLVRMKP